MKLSFRNLFRDCLLILKNIPLLFKLASNNAEDAETLHRLNERCQVFRPTRSGWYTLYQLLVPRFVVGEHRALYVTSTQNLRYDSDDHTFFYINGIMTSENLCEYQTRLLSRTLNHRVVGLYNPTNGFLIDLLECVLGRTFNFKEPIDKCFCKIIKNELQNTTKIVTLVGHSQGGIIISNLLKMLYRDNEVTPEQLGRLHVVTFGSAADEFLNHSNVTHFANSDDFIAQIGVLGCAQTTHGEIIVADRSGHSFERHYLTGLVNGEYGSSCEIYKYIQTHF